MGKNGAKEGLSEAASDQNHDSRILVIGGEFGNCFD
jgi:hypothetical protein